MEDNFSKFKLGLNKKASGTPLQQVQPIIEKSEKKVRYPGTRQLNVDLDEELFIALKTKSVLERKPVRELVQEAVQLFLK